MVNSRDTNKVGVTFWVDKKLLEKWEKRCCHKHPGKPAHGYRSKRIIHLIEQDAEKHRRLYPKANWHGEFEV